MRLLRLASLIGAVVVPVSLLPVIGLTETWEAFDRYQAALLSFPEHHKLRVPAPEDAVRDYAALDADLVRWHADMDLVYQQCTAMAVVGQMEGGDSGLEFEFNRQAGAEQRAVKQTFFAKRDGTLLLYLALCLLPNISSIVPLSMLVLCLNLVNLAVCLRLKGLTDALSKSVEQLQNVQQSLLLLPLESTTLQLQQQGVCLLKLAAMSQAWEGTTFGYSITLPLLGSLSVSVNIMGALAAATSARCLHRIARGLPPELRQLLSGRPNTTHHHHHHTHSHDLDTSNTSKAALPSLPGNAVDAVDHAKDE